MSKQLPPRSDLRQLKIQAKDLHKAHQQENPEAVQRIKNFHPQFTDSTDADLSAFRFGLQDAQLVIAREYGFPSWPKLVIGVASVTHDSPPSEESARLIRDLLAEQTDQQSPGMVNVAILILSLDVGEAAEVLKYLSDAEIDEVIHGLSQLRDLPTERQQQALTACAQAGRTVDLKDVDPLGFGLVALEISVGPQRAAEIFARQNLPMPKKRPAHRPKLSREYLTMKHDLRQRLQNIPSGQMDLDALSEVIVSMAEISRVEGLLALEEMADESSRMENLLKQGIRLAVDGTATDLVTNLMTTTMQALVHNYQLRCQMIIEGVKAVQNGENPRIVETRLHSFYKPQAHL
jgi:hypothetical protein